MLTCKRFKGRHTAENIYDNFESVAQLFDIDKKVKYIVSDNASSNMVKAFSLPEFEASTESEVSVASKAQNSDSADENDPTRETSELDDEDILEYLPEHLSCFAHTLQLVVKDRMKEIGSLQRVISKSSNIVSHVRKSIHASELLENFKKLQAFNVTHWNSEVKMTRSVLNIPSDKLDQLDTQKLT